MEDVAPVGVEIYKVTREEKTMPEKKGYAAILSDKKDRALDFNGLRTGVPFDKRTIITLLVCIVVFFALRALPLQAYGETTSTALALVVITFLMLMFLKVNVIVPAMLIAVLGCLLHLWDWAAVKTTVANSPMVMMTGMMIVAMGCEFTPMGKRVAFLLLKHFGQKPSALVVIIGIATAFLSGFVSNNAMIIMMSAICAEILTEMHQTPGESRLGRAIMLVVIAASMVGGEILICGSPIGNSTGISLLNEASGGITEISFATWAKIGVPAFLILMFPMGLIYVKYFKVKDKDYTDLPSKEYYDAKLRELGPVGGSEIRWILIVVGMVASMIAGMNMALASVLWAIVAMFPLVGVVPSNAVFKKLPWTIIIASAFIPIMGTCFSAHGIGKMVVATIGGVFNGLGPVAFCLVATIIQGIFCNVFVGASTAALTLGVGLMTPICISLGYNPSLIMMPVIMINSCFFIVGVNTTMLLNKGYGYWELKDPIVPGVILLLACAVVYALVTCLLGPVIGVPLYM